ncbi:shikimate dehydrogenase [Litorilituus sediminis]|uniref:Shikimate dehydrogenase (NADP(+)) n=1 Tax=Litorilituus sediminis TaxID=718192 RepID=A0A4P6P7Q1_9GAMM|nr:shikimate dehydrogenase [Litorilituus sediminis]QBG36269.1 shikimate dehydrogenase [Litorilituus sediminis]
MDNYRVFGNPIKQSRSPFIHQQFALSTNQELDYQAQLVELDQFASTVKEFIAQGGKGANITVPFKEQALELADHLTERAKLAGAVNTLSFIDDKVYGDNTDGLGLVQDLLRHQVSLKQARILLLGAGGAAKGVILPLLEQQPTEIVIANRTVSKAEQLCQQFSALGHSNLSACGFNDVNEQAFDVIINATSASLSGNIPSIPNSCIDANTVCYDMVYASELTPFLQWATEQGTEKLIDGLGMLVGQAAESFSIWRGVKPQVEPVLEDLRTQMTK